MPRKKDFTMLRVDTLKLSIAMAEKELEPLTLAARSGVAPNIIYSMRKGNYVKPIYLGKVCRALETDVKELVDPMGGTYSEEVVSE